MRVNAHIYMARGGLAHVRLCVCKRVCICVRAPVCMHTCACVYASVAQVGEGA